MRESGSSGGNRHEAITIGVGEFMESARNVRGPDEVAFQAICSSL